MMTKTRKKKQWLLLKELADATGNFAGIRMSVAFAEFVEHAFTVDEDVEFAAAAGVELGHDSEFVLQFRSQTGRAREVVSNLAVFDADLHGDNFSNDVGGLGYDLVCGNWFLNFPTR